MTKDRLKKIIRDKKISMGEGLVILGHHYQTDDIIEFADYVGDSLELSRKVSQLKSAKKIVFCGVYFMAETASVLAPDKEVYIPDPRAGCPLADMATLKDVEHAWEMIGEVTSSVIPITYVNSSVEVKAFCGIHEGVVCTSGNAARVFKWAMERADKILFMPDRNLGRNTAKALGLKGQSIIEWDPSARHGGVDKDDIKKARAILWKGWCPVHWPGLRPEDVISLRAKIPGLKVIVHPEADPSTVEESDAAGSTAQIIEYVKSLGKGSIVAVGTEFNMVNRLSEESRTQVKVLPLKKVLCEDMARITLDKLAQCLVEPDDSQRVIVDAGIAGNALKALDRMLKI